MSGSPSRPIAPGRDQILALPPMPSGHQFQKREIREDLSDVEDLADGSPIDLELRGPEGRGEGVEDGTLDAIEDMPLPPPQARSAYYLRPGPTGSRT